MLNYSIYADDTNQANQFFEVDSNGVVRTKAGVDLKTTGQTEFDVSHFYIQSNLHVVVTKLKQPLVLFEEDLYRPSPIQLISSIKILK